MASPGRGSTFLPDRQPTLEAVLPRGVRKQAGSLGLGSGSGSGRGASHGREGSMRPTALAPHSQRLFL